MIRARGLRRVEEINRTLEWVAVVLLIADAVAGTVRLGWWQPV